MTGGRAMGSSGTSDRRDLPGPRSRLRYLRAVLVVLLALVGVTGTGAANAVGGVVDNTLGNVLGAVGQRSPTNMLTAASVLLERFVNRDNPISGHLDIANGLLTDKSLVISGDRATANIVTRTNLVTSTTNTTVNFALAEDPSAAYIVASINGPLSNPSYSVNRGSAKDPPGVVNTLTNAAPNIIPGVGNVLPKVPLPNLPLPNLFGR